MTKRRTLLDDMTDTERKAVPLAAVFDYFPNVMIELARIIADGQKQHGTVGWDRSKSNDHRNSLIRHLLQWGETDKDGRSHTAKVAIRALMAAEIELEPEPPAIERKRGASARGQGGSRPAIRRRKRLS